MALTATSGHQLGKDSGVVLELRQSPVEAPDELVRRLLQLQLCRLSDFRRARAAVRRLSRDLPSFDSVWIDALVQSKVLTPFQARMLESGTGDQLLISNFVVVDKLGHGPFGKTYLARSAGRQDRVVIKRLNLAVESMTESRQRLFHFIERSRTWGHPNLVVPHAILPDHPLVAVSRWVPGLTLADLLVRRGRFPAEVVLEIGRQLASGLASLQSAGLVHGDLRLSNVRLTTAGSAVLVDGGIRPAVCPELTIHETLALEAYDGIAPELIGTGVGANAASEIYALGCLMWQLLAGRPPHSMADPLMKIAAHQTQRIADVRTLAPDTPPALAQAIQAMTSHEINERPRSFDELLQRWGRPGLSSRSILKRFRQKIDGGVPHFAQPEKHVIDGRWPWLAASLFVATGLALTLSDRGMRNEVLSLTNRLGTVLQERPLAPTEAGSTSLTGTGSTAELPAGTGLLPLPAPTPNGEILLSTAGPYEVARVAVAKGKLVIRGAPGVHPVIQVHGESLWLAADSVHLENLTILSDATTGRSPTAMLLVKSQQLTIEGCQFERRTEEHSESRATAAGQLTALAWRPADVDQSADLPKVEIHNTVFRTPGAALWFAEIPHQIDMTNCLKLGDGPAVAASPKANPHPCAMNLKGVTLRDAGSLLRLAGRYAEQADCPIVEISARDCVFALTSAKPSLIEFHTAAPRADIARSVHMNGAGSVLAQDVNLIIAADITQRSHQIIDADEQFEGLVVSDLQFQGDAHGPVVNSRLHKMTAPRSSAAGFPGVDPEHLPGRQLAALPPDSSSPR